MQPLSSTCACATCVRAVDLTLCVRSAASEPRTVFAIGDAAAFPMAAQSGRVARWPSEDNAR
eukprot:629593-Prorocentrum_minimum.AAC.1